MSGRTFRLAAPGTGALHYIAREDEADGKNLRKNAELSIKSPLVHPTFLGHINNQRGGSSMQSNLIRGTVIGVSVFFALCAGPVSKVQSAVIESRNELNSQLGPNGVTEDFETLQFPANTAERVGTLLDANSVVLGQGPGLVREGVRFRQIDTEREGLQWDRQFQYGLQSAALTTDGQMIVDFTVPVTHVGFDMFWFSVGNPPSSPATVQVFGIDDTSILHSFNMLEPSAPDSFFFGFTDSVGIGRISLFRDDGGGELGGSPIIDNLTFGFTPVPEPGTLTLAVLGLGGFAMLRRRRKS